MFFAPAVRVPTDAGSEMLHEKQAEMQAALERVRDVAESWFQLSDQQRNAKIRAEWNRRKYAHRAGS